MQLIPAAISRKIAQQGLLASENAPKALFVGGVVGMIGSTALACRATLKLETTLDKIDSEKSTHVMMYDRVQAGEAEEGLTYSEKELGRDLHIIQVKGAIQVVKLYVPSVALGIASVAALSKSHSLLQDRNLALTAAYAAVDGAFTRYRARVVDMFGEEMDRDIYYETEEVEIVDPDSGKVVSTTRVIDAPGSPYRRFFDEDTSRNWSPDPDINMIFLRTVQNYVNDRLRARGHMFLNEVYEELGLTHTKAGSQVGWRWNVGSGDDYIDFGIWDGGNERVNDFFTGREGAILLDFNVDGVMWDKIKETGY